MTSWRAGAQWESSRGPELPWKCRPVPHRGPKSARGAASGGKGGGIAPIDQWDGGMRPAFGPEDFAQEIRKRLRERSPALSGCRSGLTNEHEAEVASSTPQFRRVATTPKAWTPKAVPAPTAGPDMDRADCGWHILRTRLAPGIKTDCDRELRDAALLSQLIESTGQLGHLEGRQRPSPNFRGPGNQPRLFAMVDLLNEQKITSVQRTAAEISPWGG